MAAEPRGHRYTIEDRGDILRISMLPDLEPRTALMVLVVLFWGGLIFIILFLTLAGESVYGVGIGVSALFAIILLVLVVRSKLVVEVSSQSIAVWDEFLGIRLRSKRYLAGHIRELRVSAAIPWLAVFEYGAATVSFGRGLNAAGAAEIVAKIKRRFPQYQREHGDARTQPEQPFIETPSPIHGPSEVIEPPPLRYRSEVSGNILRITIPRRKKWLMHIIVLAFVGLLPSLILLADGVGGLIQILGVIWLALCVIFVIYNLLWELVGREQIELAPDSIVIRETILGIDRPRVYRGGDIRRMRVDPAGREGPYAPNDEGGISLSKGTGMIAFDYQGKYTGRIGICLTEAEAKELVAEIQRQYPQYK